MIACKDKNLCCGCEACVQICPIQCISLTKYNGFLYPETDKAHCVHCGQCEAVCPVIKPSVAAKRNKMQTFAAVNRDMAERMSSSSGGLFMALAHHVLQQGGCVCGVAWIDRQTVRHIIVDNESDLVFLQGSKYLQSSSGDAFQQVKRRLEHGQKVLFSGTACQVAGLKGYLKKHYENLFAVDVFCHGVPSAEIWTQHLNWQETQWNTQITAVDFRNKENGWKRYNVVYACTDGESRRISHFSDSFMQLYLSNIGLRESCYSCKFKGFPRLSDLSIGDAWGGEKLCPELSDDRGMSVVVVNSEVGEQLFNAVRGELQCCNVALNSLVPPMSDARKPVKKHPNRKKFLQDLENGVTYEKLMQDSRLTKLQRFLHYADRLWLYVYKKHASVFSKTKTIQDREE